MKKDYKTIRANKCVIGETYYMTGLWYRNGLPLINTPVIFLGKDDTSNVGKPWFEHTGKHKFQFVEDENEFFNAYASDKLFIEPVDNPNVLNPKLVKEFKKGLK